MKTTYHHLPFLPNSEQQATKAEQVFMLYSLLNNSDKAINLSASIDHKSSSIPQTLIV